ncbi:MAG: hypothetical protein JW880_06045, partial [Candidatus Thermoplasmatota archaeon]|nr:hypothetical protein [Candidatus Thermoplasmatota archaeon]
VSGVYRIDALLEDWWGHDIESVTSIAYLDATVGHVEVRFVGWLIYSNYEDGPFYVYMELYDDDGRYLDDDSLTTTAYGYTDFEGIPAQLGWPHSCYASNDDADPAYDRLVVEATVEVISAGTFYLQCYLYDDGWDYVGLVGVDATLAQGSPIVELSYPGWLLYTHGLSGAYYAYIYLYDERGNYLDSGSATSESLAWSDFDPTVPRIDSPYASSAPAIDGRMDTAEWDDAVIIELSETDPINGIDATMLIMNDETTLFICVDAYGDTTQDEWDYMSVAFDTGNDDIFTDGEEDQFVIRGNSWSPQEHYVYNSDISYWELHCSPFEHSGLLGVVGFSATAGYPANHRVYELAIPLSLLGASQGDVLGFIAGSESYYGLYDAYESRSSAWPMQLPSSFEIEQFGELALAENIVIPPPTTTAAPAGTSGSAGWFLSGVNVTLSATGGDGGVDYTQYRLDGGSWTTYSVPISVQTDGVHSLEYRSVDNAGQVEATKTLAVKIDRVASVTTGAVSGSYVWLNATDATSGVGTTKYRIDGGTWQTYSGVLNVSGEGKHTVEFHSVDAAGNAEATHSLEVEVENGQGSAILGDWTLYIVLAIIAIIAIISIGAIFGMRRRARESDAKAAIKDVGSPVSQMMEEEPPKPPDDE